MEDDTALRKDIDKFEGGDPELREHANEVVACVNALRRKVAANGPGAGGGDFQTATALVTVIEDDNTVRLRRAQILIKSIGDEVTSTDDIE
jgi:hypothetical protein